MMRDLTRGSVLGCLIRFTLPLVAGNLLQLTYNAVDAMILGRCVGSLQLAAAGTSNPLMTLVFMFLQGISLGCGVLIGQLFGEGKEKKLQAQVSTGLVSGGVFALAVSALLALFAPAFLALLQVDARVLPYASVYLRIVGLGLIFSFGSSYLSAVLRALGDSLTPLVFLALGAVLNIGGDLLFVIRFQGGIAGCALSTVLCEGLACLLSYLYCIKKIPLLNMGRKWLRCEKSMLLRTLRYAGTTAVQQSVVQAGILGVQSLVNSMGAAATAGFAAANRIDDYALIPGRHIANAMTNVLAQNAGAKKWERVKKTLMAGLALECVFGLLASLLLFSFYEPALGLFTADSAVLGEGGKYLHLIAWMYLLPALTNGMQGYFRGMGKMKITLIGSLVNMGLRFLSCAVFVLIARMGIEAVPWACFLGWMAMLVLELPLLIREWKKLRAWESGQNWR